MAASGNSRANENRKIRQEELRAKLSAGSHIEHVIDISNKLLDLDNEELDSIQVQRLKAASEIKLKLISKYLPDMKQVELSVDPDAPLVPILNVTTSSKP